MSKYPKRGEDCPHTMDCMWGVDGWCDRPKGSECVISKDKDTTATDAYMANRTKEVNCTCGGELRQTRKGSLRAKCTKCEKVLQLGERRRKRTT